jgi:Uma2 family endonuclease
MSAKVDLAAHFHAMERLIDIEPEGTRVELAHGVFMMSPRPRLRHTVVQGRLCALVDESLGRRVREKDPDWLFAVEPEIRSGPTFSRLIPDVAGWRRSTGGWPDPDINPIELMPEWVAEILSPATEAYDREDKLPAYGLMGVGWVWLVDADAKRVETFMNVRGKMVAGAIATRDATLSVPPFEPVEIALSDLFAFG